MDESLEFLRALYSEVPDGCRLLIWTLPNKRSYWAASLDEAVSIVNRVKADAEAVYFGIGLSGKDHGAHKRCLASDIVAVPGLWLDLDIASAEAHKKGNLPTSREEVLELLADAGLKPSLSVNSGHGLQCYWKFTEMQMLGSPESHERVATLSRRWNNTLRMLAKRRGWDVDATHDLARVFRVPGTMNRKVAKCPVPATTIALDPALRYTLEEIEARLIDDDTNQPVTGKTQIGSVVISDDLTLDPAATCDMELFELLAEIEPKFKMSWDRKRKDFQDQSGSSYDLSLATFAVNAGWTDQQVVDMLIHHRRKHQDKQKLRLDYYRNTLLKAKQQHARDTAIEKLTHILDGTAEEEEEATPEPAAAPQVGQASAEDAPQPEESEDEKLRRKVLTHVSDLLGFNIVRVIKYISSEPTFRLETDRGSIMLGGVNGLIRQDALRTQVAALTLYHIPRFKPNTWDTIAQSLLNAVEELSAGEEATDEGAIRTWLRVYLSENPPTQGMTEDVVLCQSPYFGAADGHIFVFGAGLADWLKKKYGENVGLKRLGALLRIHGATPAIEPCVVGGKNTTRSVWRLPYTNPEGEF